MGIFDVIIMVLAVKKEDIRNILRIRGFISNDMSQLLNEQEKIL